MLGYPFSMGDRITKVMPPAVMGKDVPLGKIFDKDHERYGEGGEFRALYEADPEVKRVSSTPPRASRASSGSGACTRPA